MICQDTQGGVQPYVALALGLQNAGHAVQAVAPARLAHLFSDRGVPVHPLSSPGGFDEMQATAIAERGTAASHRLMRRHMPKMILEATRETLAVCDGCSMLTGGVGGMIVGQGVAEKLGIPFVQSHLQPIGAPSGQYPGALLGSLPRWIGPLGYRASHILTGLMLQAMFRSAVARSRKEVLGLTSAPRPLRGPILYGFSKHIVPVPDTQGRRATGYWTLDTPDDYLPPPRLTGFLSGPLPLVSIGFGSMGSTDAAALSELVRAAARDAEVKVILLGGWGALTPSSNTDPNVFFSPSLPHDWLFPQVTAIVHHGGAGTTGAAFIAGKPQLLVPFAADQPFWASRVRALGTGPAAIPRKHLTRPLLANALRAAVGDPAMARRAQALATQLRSEHGVADAVAILTGLKKK